MGEVVDLKSEALGDKSVAHGLAYDGGEITIDQGVLVGMAGPGLSEPAGVVVDVFGAVAGVKAMDGERIG